MASTLAQPGNCCTPCDSIVAVNTPGPAGSDGADGSDGSNGLNAYTLTADSFTQPAVNSDVTVEVDDSRFMAIYMDVYQEGGGYYQVREIPDATHVVLRNRGYDANSPPGTVIPSGARLTTAGEKGETGDVDTNGALMAANNLDELTDPDLALNRLGATDVGTALVKLTNPSAISFLRVNADNTVTARSAANFRTDLSLVVGTNVQAYDADLAAIAALTSAADRVPYATGAGTWALATLTTFGRSLIDDAAASNARETLGKVLPRYGLLGQAVGLDISSALNDTQITIEATRYIVDKIIVENASTSMTTATLGMFTDVGGGGTTIAADQALSSLTSASKWDALTLESIAGTDSFTAGHLYARCGTAQAGTETVDVHVFGYRLD